jgi:hypothetical protein
VSPPAKSDASFTTSPQAVNSSRKNVLAIAQVSGRQAERILSVLRPLWNAKNAPRDQLAAQASRETGTEEKKEAQQWNRIVHLPLWWDMVAPIPGRRMSFVMTQVLQWHPTFQPTGSTKGILTRNCIA